MAKAYYTCAACKQLVAVTGSNRRDADGKAEYLQKAEAVCLDCRNREASAAGRKFAAENALPELTGTRRQIEWAQALRKDILESLDERLAKAALEIWHNEPISRETCAEAFAFLRELARASDWIDLHLHPEKTLGGWLWLRMASHKLSALRNAETLLRPDSPVSDNIVRLETHDTHVFIRALKERALIDCFKQCGCQWEPDEVFWRLECYSNPELHTAYLATRLLRAGFLVQICNCQEVLTLLRTKRVDRIACLISVPQGEANLPDEYAVVFRWGSADVTNWLQEHFPGVHCLARAAIWRMDATNLESFSLLEKDMGFCVNQDLREYLTAQTVKK